MPFNLPKLRNPTSVWELKQVIEMIDERMTELRRHRGEDAIGDYMWDSDTAKAEYISLNKKRNAIRQKILNTKSD